MERIKDVVEFLNLYLSEIRGRHTVPHFMEGEIVKVPLYRRKWKKWLIKKLKKSYFFSQRHTGPGIPWGVSLYDFSRIVPPDGWKQYTLETKKGRIFPQFVWDFGGSCWHAMLHFDYFQEDLNYGIRPIKYMGMWAGGWNRIVIQKSSRRVFVFDFAVLSDEEFVEFLEYLEQDTKNQEIEKRIYKFEIK